jgi:hypothetical protein
MKLVHAMAALTGVLAAGCYCSHERPPGDDAGIPLDAPRPDVEWPPILPCGLALEELRAELGPDVVPVAHTCLALPPGPIGASDLGGGTYALVHASAEIAADTAAITVRRYAVADGTYAPTGEPCTTTHRATQPGLRIELSPQLEVSTDGGLVAHFGLRVRGSTPSGYAVEDVSFTVGPGCAIARSGDRFCGGTMLSDDASQLFVSTQGGLSRDGARLGATEMCGSVVRFAGGVLTPARVIGHGAFYMGWLPADALRGGPYPVAPRLTAHEPSLSGGWPQEFAALGDRAIVARRGSGALEMWRASVGPTEVALGEATPFASDRFTHVASIEGTARAVLRHEAGLLVVE